MLEELLIELGHLTSPAWWHQNAVPLFNILMIDLTLAGDNAIVVGMAASRVQKELRAKVIFWGIAGAVVLRILFSGIAQQMLRTLETEGKMNSASRAELERVTRALEAAPEGR